MNYQELVNKFRELARDLLRIRWINNIQDEVLAVDNRIASLNHEVESNLKEIARNDYKLSKLEEADPDFADKTKKLEDSNAFHTAENVDLAKSINCLNKEKTELADKVAKVADGTSKVCADNLSAKAKELADAYIKEQAIQVTIE